ncbi:MAG TPA: dienelactone hydrolase family protein [Candidatus Sulfotelmatobacter sp.]|nr:dienelactone hydrolase family protein [Candidatus Sulfotelmatobacter sp.]
MLRRALLLAGFLSIGLCSAALLFAVSVNTQTVGYKSGNETVNGYLALPEGSGKHPAIVVIHEWWGLNDWVKEQTQHFAEQGYAALAVDLYRGQVGTTPDEAHILMRGLPDDRGLRDLEAAFSYLASRPDVEANKIGAIGWCMGGGWSIKLAENEPKLAAFVVNYGALPTDPATIAKIKAPMLGNFGALDKGIPPESVHAFETAMKADGKNPDIKIYEGAGHAFQNPNNKDGYRKEATEDADKRIDAFFQKELK